VFFYLHVNIGKSTQAGLVYFLWYQMLWN